MNESEREGKKENQPEHQQNLVKTYAVLKFHVWENLVNG